MTDISPLTEQQLDEITAKIATYRQHAPTGFACCTAHPVADAGAALLAEVRRLRAELSQEQRLHGDTIDERDRASDMADKLAYAVAPEDVIGEHTADNSPWANALELITSAAEVDRLRVRVTELEGPAVEARAALASLCYDLDDPGTAALGALYLISQATTGVEAPRDDTAVALARHSSEVLRTVADMADPEPPEVSFFGGEVGPAVAAWLQMLADRKDPIGASVAPSA